MSIFSFFLLFCCRCIFYPFHIQVAALRTFVLSLLFFYMTTSFLVPIFYICTYYLSFKFLAFCCPWNELFWYNNTLFLVIVFMSVFLNFFVNKLSKLFRLLWYFFCVLSSLCNWIYSLLSMTCLPLQMFSLIVFFVKLFISHTAYLSEP